MPQSHDFIVCEPEKCIGCQLCEFACSAAKKGTYDPTASLIRLVRLEPTDMMAVSCRLCENPSCVAACPYKALSVSQESGVIMVDQEKCTGCDWCIEACEFGVITLDSEKRVVAICDLCKDLDTQRCVEICARNALSLSTPEAVSQRRRKETVSQQLLKELD